MSLGAPATRSNPSCFRFPSGRRFRQNALQALTVRDPRRSVMRADAEERARAPLADALILTYAPQGRAARGQESEYRKILYVLYARD